METLTVNGHHSYVKLPEGSWFSCFSLVGLWKVYGWFNWSEIDSSLKQSFWDSEKTCLSEEIMLKGV